MGDRSLTRELKRWAIEEFNIPPQSLPHDSYIKTLCVGSGASIWKYVIRHVFNQRNVRMMRGNLQWYKILQDKELKEMEGQSEAAKRLELQREIEEMKAELNQLDSQISGAESQLAAEEQSVSRSWGLCEENRQRAVLLQAFRQRCAEERRALSGDAQRISVHSHALEDLSRKAEVELVFEPTESGDGLDPTGPEPVILRDVRNLCEERVLFFQSLQESELKTNPSTTQLTRDQRAAVFQQWLSAVESLLQSHPPSQVVSALQALASQQQVVLEEKLAALDVGRDVSALGFRYESNHLHDVSRDGEDLPPVKSLLQWAQEEVEQSYVRLSQTRSRTQQLKTELGARIKEAELRLHGQDLATDSLAWCVFGLELQCVLQAAVRDSIREQCLQLELQARERQEALKNLQTQWQSIINFRRLVDIRQEQIRSLIKANSTAKSELTRVHSEIKEFVGEKLGPQFGDVVKAAGGLRNSVSQEARQFSLVSLAALDYRVMDGEQRVPAGWLSLYRLRSPTCHQLCESLVFPMYMAPEELWSQTVAQKLELRHLRQLLQLLSSSSASLQRLTAQLPASDQQALLQLVRTEDAELLQSLLPRARELIKRCSKGLSNCSQVKTAITHWWEQPAQFAMPEMQRGGLTFHQWLQRWKLAAKGF
ncbi:HAUS augmin-like complex subunit 5 [Chanos chanos]|uniref:HAUS augmin-like complex subunit 5 n=1 Tax=Chanos chanos TaxID=29144 RepID=A0A6J2W8D4_CHACN|nr:HAUS augmin-like complex subunit 5 [Chanos chanos]